MRKSGWRNSDHYDFVSCFVLYSFAYAIWCISKSGNKINETIYKTKKIQNKNTICSDNYFTVMRYGGKDT